MPKHVLLWARFEVIRWLNGYSGPGNPTTQVDKSVKEARLKYISDCLSLPHFDNVLSFVVIDPMSIDTADCGAFLAGEEGLSVDPVLSNAVKKAREAILFGTPATQVFTIEDPFPTAKMGLPKPANLKKRSAPSASASTRKRLELLSP